MLGYNTILNFLNELVWLTFLIIGITLLCFGIFTLRRKPVIYKYYIEVILLLIVFIVLFSIFLFSIIIDHFEFRFTGWIYFLIHLLFSIKPLHTLILYNVDQKILYESIIKMLKQNNISFEVKNDYILLPSLKADIKVKIRPFNHATILFELKDKKIKNSLISDLKKNLNNKKLDKFPFFNIVTIVSSIILIYLLILLWIIDSAIYLF